MTDQLPERPPRFRRFLAMSLLTIVVAAAAIAVSRRSQDAGPEPPRVPLDDSSPLVAAAINESRQAVAVDRGSAAAWGAYGMCLYAHGFTDAALLAFSQAERLDAEDYRWPYLSGLAATFTDPERGRRSFERASQLRPGAVFVRLRTAELLLDLNLTEDASEHVRAALALEPANPWGLLAAARLAYLQGELEQSRTLAEQALQLLPTLSAASELLARICFQSGDGESAREYQSHVRADSSNIADWPDPLYAEVMQKRRDSSWLLANIQRQQDSGQTAAAVSQLERALDQDPDLLEFRIELIQTLLQAGDYDKAQALLEQGLQRRPGSARLVRMRGVLHHQRGEYAHAALDFRRAIELKDDYGLAYVNLGESLWQTGDTPAALAALERALLLQPTLPGMAERIAQIRSGEE